MDLFGDEEEILEELNQDLLPSLGFSLRFERTPGYDGKLAFFMDRREDGQTVSERLMDQGDGIRSLVSVALSVISSAPAKSALSLAVKSAGVLQPLQINAASCFSCSLNCVMETSPFVSHWGLFPFTQFQLHSLCMRS
jgi:hypothetical protein